MLLELTETFASTTKEKPKTYVCPGPLFVCTHSYKHTCTLDRHFKSQFQSVLQSFTLLRVEWHFAANQRCQTSSLQLLHCKRPPSVPLFFLCTFSVRWTGTCARQELNLDAWGYPRLPPRPPSYLATLKFPPFDNSGTEKQDLAQAKQGKKRNQKADKDPDVKPVASQAKCRGRGKKMGEYDGSRPGSSGDTLVAAHDEPADQESSISKPEENEKEEQVDMDAGTNMDEEQTSKDLESTEEPDTKTADSEQEWQSLQTPPKDPRSSPSPKSACKCSAPLQSTIHKAMF